MSERGGCGARGKYHVDQSGGEWIWYIPNGDEDMVDRLECNGNGIICPACAEAYRAEHGALKELFQQIETDASDVYAVAMKELDVHNALRAIERRKGDG